MSKRYRIARGALLTVIVAASGCASSATVKTVAPDALWQEARQKMAAEKWTDAARLFERFTLEFPTDTRYQEARYNIGEAHFGAKEYITSASEFARLVSDYPGGPFADDAQSKVCESYARLSPDIQLDQQYTQTAIEQCQAMLAYFPASEHVPAATVRLAEMVDKLAHKAYWTGDFYFRRKAYDSANMYYEIAARDYPTSVWAPRALSRMIDTYKVLKYDAEEAAVRARLLKDYPDSPEAKALANAGTTAAPSPKPDSLGLR